MKTVFLRGTFLLGFACGMSLGALGQHAHVAVGTVDTGSPGPDQGEALQFIVGGSLSGNVYRMLPVPTGQKYGGYYSLNETFGFSADYFTIIALSDGQTQLDGTNHAKTGAYIWLEITSVTGPAGAQFGFWDENQASFRTTPNISFLTNTPTGGYKFEISEPLSQPAAPSGAIFEPPGNLHYIINGTTTGLTIDPTEDPYGHIHNRGWTADQPGDYFVGFKLYDMSTNGTAGGPIHAPSQTYVLHFQAVPEPGSFALLMAGVVSCAIRRRRS